MGSRRARLVCVPVTLLCLFALLTAVPVQADDATPDEALESARFEQRLNAQTPLDLAFRDETGQDVRLGSYLGEKPVILALVYYNCPNICSVVLNDLVENLRELPFELGREFDVVTVSIDPRETPELAAASKDTYVHNYGRAGVEHGWHALTGTEKAIQRLASVVGFQYAYDARLKQYAHPSGLLVVTPEGKISSYLYGLVYSPTDLRLALVEASENKIGSPIDQVLLRCYQYDPVSGKYTVTVMNIVRLGGLITTIVLGGFLVTMVRGNRRISPF